MRRTAIIESVDGKLGADHELILLKDIITVSDRLTGQGFSIRELAPLNDGNHYLPAHLIPVLGHEIAEKNGMGFAEFFKHAWAEALGRAQAKLLVRYGIEFNPINPQNFLIQLDHRLKPTGRLACRDLGDTFQVESISSAIGLGKEVIEDKALGIKTFPTADPSTKAETLTWGFNLSGNQLLLPVTRNSWIEAHDDAFISEIGKLTGIQVPHGYGAYAIDRFLAKTENQAALLRFHKKQFP